MNAYKITFIPKTHIKDDDDILGSVWALLGGLYRNGQMIIHL